MSEKASTQGHHDLAQKQRIAQRHLPRCHAPQRAVGLVRQRSESTGSAAMNRCCATPIGGARRWRRFAQTGVRHHRKEPKGNWWRVLHQSPWRGSVAHDTPMVAAAGATGGPVGSAQWTTSARCRQLPTLARPALQAGPESPEDTRVGRAQRARGLFRRRPSGRDRPFAPVPRIRPYSDTAKRPAADTASATNRQDRSDFMIESTHPSKHPSDPTAVDQLWVQAGSSCPVAELQTGGIEPGAGTGIEEHPLV